MVVRNRSARAFCRQLTRINKNLTFGRAVFLRFYTRPAVPHSSPLHETSTLVDPTRGGDDDQTLFFCLFDYESYLCPEIGGPGPGSFIVPVEVELAYRGFEHQAPAPVCKSEITSAPGELIARR